MERVWITGGAGYIGSVLTRALLDAGHAVTVLDRFLFGRAGIEGLAGRDGLTVVEADVRDRRAVADAMRDADRVVHLAGIVGYPACRADPEKATDVNIGGTQVVLGALGGRPLLLASTQSVYGVVDGQADEDTPPRPVSLYGRNKAEAEEMVRRQADEHVILRLATVFGVSPRMRVDLLINDFVYQAIHSGRIVLYEGHFRRAFVHVRDVCGATLFAMARHDDMRGRTFNVGNDEITCTKLEIAERIGRHVPLEIEQSDKSMDLDRRNYSVDCGRRGRLGYRPQVGLDEGLEELVERLRDFTPDRTHRNL